VPRLLSTLLVLALVSGCATARMKLDPALTAASEEWPVSGANPRSWDAPLAVGPYRTAAVRDAGRIGWSVQSLSVGVSSTHRPYAWVLAGPGRTVEAECHERGFEAFTASGYAIDAQGASGRPVLACAFRGAGEGTPAAWTLTLRATGKATSAFAGELRDEAGGATYTVRASHALEGSPLPLGTPAGYAVEREGATVLVVETLGAGRVWIRTAAADGDALAAASVALLLFHPDED
jgi:hypothetical protein